MRQSHRNDHRWLLSFVTALGLAVPITAKAQSAIDMCAAITEPTARLTCFDAVTLARRGENAMDRCAAVGDSTARLTCFDAVAQARKEGTTPAAATTTPSAPPARTAAAAPSPAAALPTSPPSVPKAAPSPSSSTAEQALATARAEAEAARKAAADAEAELAALKAAGDVNGEPRTKKRERYSATISKARHNFDRKLVVQLDNGEIWQQTDGGFVSLPDAGDPIEIKPGWLGSNFMKLPDKGVTLRARLFTP